MERELTSAEETTLEAIAAGPWFHADPAAFGVLLAEGLIARRREGRKFRFELTREGSEALDRIRTKAGA